MPLRSRSPCRQAQSGASQHVWRGTVRGRGREKQQTHTSEGPCTGITPRSSSGAARPALLNTETDTAAALFSTSGLKLPLLCDQHIRVMLFGSGPSKKKSQASPRAYPHFTPARERTTNSELSAFSAKTHQSHI